MAYARDFQWTVADQVAGFPQLHAAFAATEIAVLVETYAQQMRDCFSQPFARNMRILQRELGGYLLCQGITEVPNIFGPIPITDKW
jgi:hypothetical protein